nr:hypothetical protein [Desulfobacterales bacterium]
RYLAWFDTTDGGGYNKALDRVDITMLPEQGHFARLVPHEGKSYWYKVRPWKNAYIILKKQTPPTALITTQGKLVDDMIKDAKYLSRTHNISLQKAIDLTYGLR